MVTNESLNDMSKYIDEAKCHQEFAQRIVVVTSVINQKVSNNSASQTLEDLNEYIKVKFYLSYMYYICELKPLLV